LEKQIILVEGKEDIEILKKKLQTNNSKIICFDFLAHEDLEKLRIKHDIIEDYLDENDKEKLDLLAVEFSKKWHRIDSIKQWLEYNEINVGEIIEGEALGYFVTILRRIKGILKIIEREEPETIVSSSLSNIAENLCNEKGIKLIKFQIKKEATLAHDQLEIPFNIKNKTFSIKISRSKYLLIKKISEYVIESFFKLKLKTGKEKTVLLLDFNPIDYKLLLKELSKVFVNVALLNQRKPAIWNVESFKNVKNLGVKVIRLENFESKKIKNRIQNIQKKKQNELQNLFNSECLQKYFEVEGYHFWDSIQQGFLKILEKRMDEMVYRYTLCERMFSTVQINAILEWSHKGFEEKIIIAMANKKKIPCIYLQHAMDVENYKFDKYLTIRPIGPSNNVKEAVWGNTFKEFLIDKNMNKDEIVVSGSPKHDEFFNEHSIEESKDSILLAISGFLKFTMNGNDTNAYIKHKRAIKEIIEVVKNKLNKKIIVKLHPAPFYFNPEQHIHELDPNIQIYKNKKIIELIKSSDLVITTNHSTILLEAMILKKPCICICVQEPSMINESWVKSEAVLFVSNVKEIKEALEKILLNKEFRKKMISNGEQYVKNYCSNPGTASKEIAKILKEMTK